MDEPAASSVTGSMIYIESENHKILVDAGLHQSNNKYEDFMINNRRYKAFNPKDIDYIFITHNHSDHFCLLPKLYKLGCKAKIIVSQKSSSIMNRMLEDSAFILERDIDIINNQKNKNYQPLYTIDDVIHTMNYVNECEIDKKIIIDDSLSFKLIPNGHLYGSVQILLYIKENNIEKKILITGDIGNYKIHNYYVNKFEPVTYADVVIGEATYGDKPNIKTGQKERNNDIEKLFSIITTQVCELKGQLLIPTFANHRLQLLTSIIYLIMKDVNFPYKVYIDTPLGIDLFKKYLNILENEEFQLLNDVMNWENLIFIKNAEDSKALIKNNEPCVILSTSGMCQNGRIRHHLKKAVPNPNSTILFVGFSTPGSLANLLRSKDTKTITIDQKQYVCRCSTYSLKSLSGHAPFNLLLNYYSSINTPKIILHHGSDKAKLTLKKALEEKLEYECKSTRIIVSNQSLRLLI